MSAAARELIDLTCRQCGKVFQSTRRDAVLCSNTCRQRAHAARVRDGKRASRQAARQAVGALAAVPGVAPADLGLSPVMLQRLIARSQARAGVGIDPALRKITTAQIIEQLDDKISRAFGWLDDAAMAMSGAKDLSVMAGILIDKRAMLKGEAAEAPSAAARAKLAELLPALQAELSRRMEAAKVIEGAAVAAEPPKRDEGGADA